MPKIGGPGRIVEFDQTCLVHQKHHRGAKKAGSQVWYAVGVERRLDYGEGRCFAVRVEKRDINTLDWVLTNYVAPGWCWLLRGGEYQVVESVEWSARECPSGGGLSRRPCEEARASAPTKLGRADRPPLTDMREPSPSIRS